MKVDKIAKNLLEDKTCNSCRGCMRERMPKERTCTDWESKLNIDEIISRMRVRTMGAGVGIGLNNPR